MENTEIEITINARADTLAPTTSKIPREIFSIVSVLPNEFTKNTAYATAISSEIKSSLVDGLCSANKESPAKRKTRNLIRCASKQKNNNKLDIKNCGESKQGRHDANACLAMWSINTSSNSGRIKIRIKMMTSGRNNRTAFKAGGIFTMSIIPPSSSQTPHHSTLVDKRIP